ncbi:MAG: ComF family protein [Patescibacteria group bacterium]
MTLKLLTKVKEEALELFFPIKCAACERVPMPKASRILDGKAIGKTNRIKNKLICTECLGKLSPSLDFFCPLCEAKTADGKLCFSCNLIINNTKNNFYLDRLFHPFSYKDFKIQKIIKAFKYRFIKDLEIPLGRLMIKYLDKIKDKIDLSDLIIVPIPLHKRKFNQRGYNQSELIAQKVFEYLKPQYQNTEIFSDALIKNQMTKDQAELDSEKRISNLKDVFKFEGSESVSRKRILLIDDVYTTGATMGQCAKVLKEAGAKEVIGLAIARG